MSPMLPTTGLGAHSKLFNRCRACACCSLRARTAGRCQPSSSAQSWRMQVRKGARVHLLRHLSWMELLLPVGPCSLYRQSFATLRIAVTAVSSSADALGLCRGGVAAFDVVLAEVRPAWAVRGTFGPGRPRSAARGGRRGCGCGPRCFGALLQDIRCFYRRRRELRSHSLVHVPSPFRWPLPHPHPRPRPCSRAWLPLMRRWAAPSSTPLRTRRLC